MTTATIARSFCCGLFWLLLLCLLITSKLQLLLPL